MGLEPPEPLPKWRPCLVDFSFSLTIIFVAHCEMGWILNEFMDDRGVFIDNYDS